MTPNKIKIDKGTTTYNAKTGTTIVRDSGKREVKPSVDVSSVPAPPKIIKTKREKELWNRLVSAMPDGVYSILDESLLAAYVHLVVEFEDTIEEARNQPLMLQGSQGQPVHNPIRKSKGELAAKIASAGARLGLDPIARNSINAPTGLAKPGKTKDIWGMA